MSLIPKDKLTTLNSASICKSTAESALDDIQLMTVAYAINTAANSGEKRVEFTEPMRQATLDALTANGYTYSQIGIAKKSDIYLIEWK